MTEKLWTLQELSEYLGLEASTLHIWRHQGRGPESLKIGGRIRYRDSVVSAWVSAQNDATRRGETVPA